MSYTEEALLLREYAPVKQSLSWKIASDTYTILNVPTYKDSSYGDSFDTDVTMKISIIRDLMKNKKISNTVDFDVIAKLMF